MQDIARLGCDLSYREVPEHLFERSIDATNVFVTITARAMNADLMIIARGENPRTEDKLLVCGANKVVLPAAIGATKVSKLIIRTPALTKGSCRRGRGRVCILLLGASPQAELSEIGDSIGIRDVTLHVLPRDHVLKFGKQRNQADITVDNFL